MLNHTVLPIDISDYNSSDSEQSMTQGTMEMIVATALVSVLLVAGSIANVSCIVYFYVFRRPWIKMADVLSVQLCVANIGSFFAALLMQLQYHGLIRSDLVTLCLSTVFASFPASGFIISTLMTVYRFRVLSNPFAEAVSRVNMIISVVLSWMLPIVGHVLVACLQYHYHQNDVDISRIQIVVKASIYTEGIIYVCLPLVNVILSMVSLDKLRKALAFNCLAVPKNRAKVERTALRRLLVGGLTNFFAMLPAPVTSAILIGDGSLEGLLRLFHVSTHLNSFCKALVALLNPLLYTGWASILSGLFTIVKCGRRIQRYPDRRGSSTRGRATMQSLVETNISSV